MDFVDYVRVVKRFWALIAVMAIVFAVVAGLVAKAGADSYQSTVRVAVGPAKSIELDSDVADSVNTLDKRSVISTYAELGSSDRMKDAAAKDTTLRARNFDASTVVLAQANAVELTVTGDNKAQVKQFVSALATSTNAYFESFYRLYQVDTISGSNNSESAGVSPLGAAIVAGIIGAAVAFLIGLGRQRLTENPVVA